MFKLKNSIQITITIFLYLLAVRVGFAQETETVVRIVPIDAEVSVGETIQVAVEFVNISDLYGADVMVNFDPDVLEVVDADPDLEGTQVAFGTFLDPGLVIINSVDNETGMIHFAMTQLNPSEAKSGTGIFIVITFLAQQISADTPVSLSNARPSTRSGIDILTEIESSNLQVLTGTPNGPTRTPIPIQLPGTPLPDSTDNLVTNTPRPTATAGETNNVTNTPPASTATAVSTNTVTTNNQPTVASTSAANSTQSPAAIATALPTANTTTSTDSTEANPVATESMAAETEAIGSTDTDGAELAESANVAATAVSAINPTIGSNTDNANQSAVQTIGENVQPLGTAVATTNAPAENNPLPFVMALLVSLVIILIIAVVIIQRRQSRSQG